MVHVYFLYQSARHFVIVKNSLICFAVNRAFQHQTTKSLLKKPFIELGSVTLCRNMSGFASNNISYLDVKRQKLSESQYVRRKNYSCRDKFVELKDIQPWPVFAKQNSYEISKSSLPGDVVKNLKASTTYKVDDQINQKVSVFAGDITKLEVDAIVNAANNSLLGGGGVDAAIHRGAGGHMLAECQTLNGCDTGDAKITGGYNLPARYVIHTVGPVGEKPAMLEQCYRRAMQLAVENHIKSIAFPCISTGVYGYPNEKAVQVVLPVIRTALEAHRDKFERVIFCLFLDIDKKLYNRYLPIYFPSNN